MVMGVRDNSAHMLYKNELEAFFADPSRSDRCQLTVACSRNIEEAVSHESANIVYQRGYIQDCLKEINLQEWTGGSTEGLYVLVCGNKNALGKTTIQSLNYGSNPEAID